MNSVENNSNMQEFIDGNTLEKYLEEQIEEYTSECESMKAMYVTLLDHIQECKAQLNSLKGKEDAGFSMFSPIPVESAYQTQIVRMESQLEAYEKQREKYVKDIRFYEAKIEEMISQLEEYRAGDSVRKETASSIINEEIEFVDDNFELEENNSMVVDSEELKNLQVLYSNQKQKEKANYDYIVHKIGEIKSYLKVDMMRSQMELERLEQYMKNLIENQ